MARSSPATRRRLACRRRRPCSGWRSSSSPIRYDRGPNDKGIGIQLAHSLGRVAAGYLLALAVAVPFGFLIGMSPLALQVLNPFIQLLRPISPLAWMPIALFVIKDSAAS